MRFRPTPGTGRLTPAPAVRLALAAVGTAALAAGCLPRREEASTPRTPRDVSIPEYLEDTVGEVARFAGNEPLIVQGYGFVTGLDGTGTTVVPPGIRRRMLETMRRQDVAEPEQILASRDTAVVSVFGEIPPGAARGEHFDLGVRAVPGTETTSLAGGFVLECDLHRVRVARGVEARSEPLALGRGSIFVSPFTDDEGEPGGAGVLQGRILNGGRAIKPRQFRLVLLVPSVRTADQVVRLINSRFPDAAEGTRDPARVDLAVPEAFRDDKARFLELIGLLYMREMAGARQQRVRLLLDTLRNHEDMDRAALCLEAFGAAIAPQLYPLGDSEDQEVRFYAGRTLAHLQDARAVHVLEPIALNDESPNQEDAVKALGRLRSGLGLGVLGRALNARSVRVRVAAWRAMADLVPRTFLARTFEGKFHLHVVATDADPFVYVSRTGRAEIALFGRVPVRPPVLAETHRVTATARADQDRLHLISRRGDRDIHLEADLTVRSLIETMAEAIHADESAPREVTGLGLGFSDVVGLLHEMDRKGALGGPIVLQPLEYRLLGPSPRLRPIRPAEEEPESIEPGDRPAESP
ncbi:MAG: flagellar basal body P-ring protein FlgI [Phycisphaerae bacterium]